MEGNTKVSPLGNIKMPARKLVMFFIVDTSYSMEGNKIGALNNAVEEILPMIGDISASNNDAEIEIAVLKFSSGAEWMYDNPIPAQNFNWMPLTVDGLTDFGEACEKLREKLNRKDGGFMQSASGSYAPVFILLSDGEPTDNYKNSLDKLKKNKWFDVGIKIAIAIGEDANKDVLAEFTGNREAVYTVHNVDALKKIIRLVSVTSSMIGSSSSDTSGQTKQEQVQKEIKKEIQEDIDEGTIIPADNTTAIPIDDDWE